jgi:hypothetical protein
MDRRCDKSLHAHAYIEYVSLLFADTIPTDADKKALPYETVNQFYQEYSSFCESTLLLKPDDYCKIETFRTVFNSISDIRLVGCKGK